MVDSTKKKTVFLGKWRVKRGGVSIDEQGGARPGYAIDDGERMDAPDWALGWFAVVADGSQAWLVSVGSRRPCSFAHTEVKKRGNTNKHKTAKGSFILTYIYWTAMPIPLFHPTGPVPCPVATTATADPLRPHQMGPPTQVAAATCTVCSTARHGRDKLVTPPSLV